ncbi:hypothetical protein [Paenibacillus sp.]|uniref:hypothetical protein n=1 Tax=Paenibacillus sp. TaxID=58172 RepID=UPI002D533B73|nr:hypothetical protein [Paenibacillus sp.]HZG58488.1 hypothetical protein [Paenibacillus sp.]
MTQTTLTPEAPAAAELGKKPEHPLDRLLDEVLERHMQPEDRYEIAAILESMGWNDKRAQEAFGSENIFELADDLWERSQSKVLYTPFTKVQGMGAAQLAMELTRNFLRGLIFAIPMAISVVAMITLKFSLWSYENLRIDYATGIAIGTILSFVTVGGFTQAIARRGFFYIIQGYYNMARRVTFYLITLGFILCLVLCALLFLFNLVVNMFPNVIIGIIILYFFFLNSIWLSVTVMYILKKELAFTGLIIVGIGIVYVLFEWIKLDIIVSQLIALSIVTILSIVLVFHFFRAAERKAERGIAPKLPKMSVMMYSTLPYFVYGILYFAFLFVDRMMAWSTNSGYMPYIIWFRGEYELGLDFALLVLMFPMGFSEVVLTKLMMDIEVSQKSYLGEQIDVMNRTFLRMYYNRLLTIAAISTACGVALYGLLYLIFRDSASIGQTLFGDPVTHFVFIVSIVAYVLVAVALMNAVILFSMSQPIFVIQSIWPAFLTNVVAGFLLSRWVGYEYAVVGLLLGSIVFVVLSIRKVKGLFKHLDYYLYAAS